MAGEVGSEGDGHADAHGAENGPENGRASGFPGRREPSEQEIARARLAADRIWGLAALEVSRAQIGRLTHLPVAAVEAVLSEARPAAPPGAPRDDDYGWPMSGEAPPRSPPPAVATTIYDGLRDTLRLAGVNAGAAELAIRRFGFYNPNDYAKLSEILSEMGVPQAAVRSGVSYYRELTEGPSKAVRGTEAEDPNARLQAKLSADLESRLLLARIRSIEREGQPSAQGAGDPALTAKIGSLEAMVSNLTHTLEADRTEARHRAELRDQEERHARELAAARSAIPSEGEIDRKKALNAAELQAAALARGVDALGRRLDSAGGLQQLAKAAIGAATPEVSRATVDSVRTLATAWRSGTAGPDGPGPTGGPTQEGLEVAAELLRKVRGGAA